VVINAEDANIRSLVEDLRKTCLVGLSVFTTDVLANGVLVAIETLLASPL